MEVCVNVLQFCCTERKKKPATPVLSCICTRYKCGRKICVYAPPTGKVSPQVPYSLIFILLQTRWRWCSCVWSSLSSGMYAKTLYWKWVKYEPCAGDTRAVCCHKETHRTADRWCLQMMKMGSLRNNYSCFTNISNYLEIHHIWLVISLLQLKVCLINELLMGNDGPVESTVALKMLLFRKEDIFKSICKSIQSSVVLLTPINPPPAGVPK